jgi:hypothetical protein
MHQVWGPGNHNSLEETDYEEWALCHHVDDRLTSLLLRLFLGTDLVTEFREMLVATGLCAWGSMIRAIITGERLDMANETLHIAAYPDSFNVFDNFIRTWAGYVALGRDPEESKWLRSTGSRAGQWVWPPIDGFHLYSHPAGFCRIRIETLTHGLGIEGLSVASSSKCVCQVQVCLRLKSRGDEMHSRRTLRIMEGLNRRFTPDIFHSQLTSLWVTTMWGWRCVAV